MAHIRGRRLLLTYAIVVLSIVVLVGRLWYVQIYSGAYYGDLADQNHFRLESVPAMRGVIYDRHGAQLAENVPSFALTLVYADLPAQQRSSALDQELARVAALTGLDVADLENAAKPAEKNASTPITLARNLPRDQALAVMESYLDLPGISITTESERHYPYGSMLASILGYVGLLDPATYQAALTTDHPYQLDDSVGKAGLEYQYENELRGIPGSRQVLIDVGGRVVREERATLPVPGSSLMLTVDMRLEQQVEAALREQLRTSHASVGGAIVLDVHTGDILAAVSLPSYDDNLFAQGISPSAWQQLLDDPHRPLLDRTMSSQQPLGSLFEPFLAAGALQEHELTPDAQSTCVPLVETSGVMIRNSQLAPPHPVTLSQALTQGCDSFFATIAGGGAHGGGLGPSRTSDYAHAFGFGKLTGLDVAGEVAGVVPDPASGSPNYGQPWSQLDTFDLALGRSSMVATPLQVAVAIGAIGNGGTLVQPHYVARVDNSLPDQGQAAPTPTPSQPSEITRHVPLDADVVRELQTLLAQSAREGVGSGMRDETPAVAGMPGTADSSDVGVVLDAPQVSWWAGYAPATKPQVAVVVVIPDGGRGETAALPAARRIIDAYYAEVANAAPSHL